MWKKVVAKLSKKTGFNLLADPFSFEMAMYKNQVYGSPPPFTEKIFRALFVRILQYYPFGLLTKIFEYYVQRSLCNNWLFFDTIGEVTGAKYVVDSSKDIVRMALLRQKRPTDLCTILLIRDVVGVAASAEKRGKDPMEATYLWIKLYRQYLNILKKQKDLPVQVIYYEELADTPEKTRDQLANFLSIDLPSAPLSINTRDYHLVAGNPMRYKGKITIQYDDSWKYVLAPEIQKKILALKKSEPVFAEIEALAQKRVL